MNHSIGKRGLGSECYWDGEEIAVAEILVQLLDLIPAYDFFKPSFTWGAKRRRSVISPPIPSPPLAVTSGETKSNTANSPATPLMFSPSESEDKGKTQSHVSVCKRKNKEELMQSFTDLTHQKDSLVKEMETVKRHLDNLKASNLELKNRKQVQIIYGLAQPALQALHHQQLHYPHPNLQQQQPFQFQWNSGYSSSFVASSPSSPPADKMTPVGLPDLNLTLEEAAAVNVEGYQPSDAMMMMAMDYNVNKALASAQARKRRMQIYKEKNQKQCLRQR
ncbi:hypothetical protein QQ045_029255 [Rhodiola kirilowii]